MLISKEPITEDNGIMVNGIKLEKLHKLVYLDNGINDQYDPTV